MALAQFPASAVKEGTVATFNCSSDEANPPRLIHWNQGSGNAKYKPGRYHALSVESTLRIAVDRTMNQEIISCFTEEDKRHDRLEEKITLSVTCECFYCFILDCHCQCVSVKYRQHFWKFIDYCYQYPNLVMQLYHIRITGEKCIFSIIGCGTVNTLKSY